MIGRWIVIACVCFFSGSQVVGCCSSRQNVSGRWIVIACVCLCDGSQGVGCGSSRRPVIGWWIVDACVCLCSSSQGAGCSIFRWPNDWGRWIVVACVCLRQVVSVTQLDSKVRQNISHRGHHQCRRPGHRAFYIQLANPNSIPPGNQTHALLIRS